MTTQQLKEATRMSRDAFRQTDVADILKNYRKSAPLTADQRRCVLGEVHRLFAETEASLRESYPALSDEDVELCLLSALQYPVSAVADCLSVSEEAVRVRKHRLKGKLPQEMFGVFWEGRAGTRLLKTLFMKDAMQNVWRRFPLTVVWLVLLTAYAIWRCWTKASFVEGQHIAILYGLSMGVVLAATLSLWGEEVKRSSLRWWITLAAFLLLIVDVVYLFMHPEAVNRSETVIAHLSVAMALAVAFFYGSFSREKDDLPVWNFTWRTFLWFCISFLTGGILTAGLLALVGSFRWLFGLHVAEEWYATLAILTLLTTPVLLFLARIPEGEEKHSDVAVISKYLIFVIRYLFVPLMALYLIVLYIYGLRILVRWELPNGGVGWLVSALMAGCVVVELGLYPLMRSGEVKPFERWIVRWLPVLILPLLLLMTVGTVRRLSDYGVTPPRLYLLTFNLGCYAVCIGLFVGRAWRIRWIMTLLAAVFLLTSALPVNYTSISLRVRRHKLDRLIESTLPADLPMDEEALATWFHTFDGPQQSQIHDELDFLLETDPRSVADLTTITRSNILPWAGEYEALDEENRSIQLAFDGPFVVPEGYSHFYESERTYLSKVDDDAKVMPDGSIRIERKVDGQSAKIALSIGEKEVLSCLEEPKRTTPLLGYSADSTYVLIVTDIDLNMERDSTISWGSIYGYLFSK